MRKAAKLEREEEEEEVRRKRECSVSGGVVRRKSKRGVKKGKRGSDFALHGRARAGESLRESHADPQTVGGVEREEEGW